jgi:carbon monoxide dehydrogenase subunit G
MTIFESKININRPVSEVYTFLADMNNHQQLMPENIINWSSTADEVHFTIQNMASLALRVESRTENSEIKIAAFEKPPFDIQLKWMIAATGDTTEALFTIAADLGMMMKMLASGPLQKLADHETRSLAGALS